MIAILLIYIILFSYFAIWVPNVKAEDTEYIPEDGRLFFIGLNSDIPAGWSEDTSFNDSFIQGSDITFTVSTIGGSLNHTHELSNFTAIGNSHTHGLSGTSGTGAGTIAGNTPAVGSGGSDRTHSHTGSTNSAVITYNKTKGSINESASIPPYVRAIVIKPDDALQGFPVGACAFTDNPTLPDGFTLNTTYNNSFILGALAGGDGGAEGGNLNHTHLKNASTLSIANSHNHGTSESDYNLGEPPAGNIPIVIESFGDHHDVPINTNTSGNAVGNLIVNNASNEPSYVKLLLICNYGESELTAFDNIIIPSVSPTIPANWRHANGTYDANTSNRQIKITGDIAEINDTGGSDLHNHTDVNVFTVSDSHKHIPGSASFNSNFAATDSGFAGRWLTNNAAHSHTWSVSSQTPTVQNGSVVMTQEDKRYKYRTVLFIKKAVAGIPGNTCTYGSGDWEVSCSDYCFITDDVDLQGNNLILTGSGVFTLNATILNKNKIIIFEPCRLDIISPHKLI